MNEIIKFPKALHCDGCGKPLDPGEGAPCPVDDCETLGCCVCADGSKFCNEHIRQDPAFGKGLEGV
jgi:hypothetical protein